MKYEIGGKTYVQRTLVLGQTRQLLGVVRFIKLPGDLEIRSLIEALGPHLPGVLAVVLTEEGKSPRDKDLEVLAAELEFSITLEQTAQVIEDFFSCNPLPSLLDKLTQAAGKISAKIGKPKTESNPSASSSQAETSAAGTESSGDSPQPSADPGANTGSGT
jgi:hypothetical protein